MASSDDLDAHRKLLALEEVRVAMARAELADAERQRLDCIAAMECAERGVEDAYLNWANCIGSGLLGPGAMSATADRLLAAEMHFTAAGKQSEAAAREADRRAQCFGDASARQRSRRDQLRKLEHRSTERAVERQHDELADLFLARRSKVR